MTTENKFEGLFIIGYGLGGGFGGIRNYEVIEATDIENASDYAYQSCCEKYERYSGSNGLREIGEIMEEDGVEEEEAEEIYTEERESWLDYSVQPYSKEYEKKISGNHYHNPFKDRTDI